MEAVMEQMNPMPMCPMAETCKGMMEKPRSGFMLLMPGLVLIILGVAVLIEPKILAWLVAISLIFMGIAMLMLARFMRNISGRFQSMRR
jgi:uncharacterized membrane protein HdeD (DUF308 family)